jgi:delta endotoxin, N-terminal domain
MAIQDIVRGIVVAGLSQTPYVGWLASSLADALWPPSGENIWQEIEANVEALIGQQLNQYTQQQVTEDLTGLQNVLADYNSALKDSAGNPSFISENFVTARGQFDAIRPHFMSAGNEVLLLPLMAQMANLHLGLLRDGVQFGKSWGWNDQEVADQETQLKARISDYTTWVSIWYANGLNALSGSSWQAQNAFVRQMTLGATDFAYYWPSFDPQTNPGGTTLPVPTREIYSDPIGYEQDYPITPAAAPAMRLSNLSMFGLPFVVTVVVGAQTAYGGNWGPQMGYNGNGVTNQPPVGWTGAIHADNPIVEAGGSAGPGGPNNGGWITAWFKFKDGTTFSVGKPGTANTYDLSYPGHIMSGITVLAADPGGFFVVDGVVYGFRLEAAY